jgi:hypothetical protein
MAAALRDGAHDAVHLSGTAASPSSCPDLLQNLALGPLLAAANANRKLVDADSVQQSLLDGEAP